MRWRRALLVPEVVRLAARAPRDVSSRWNRYWAATVRTGDGGDVLWDADGAGEADRLATVLAEHADAALPVVDVGCGNGRLTRALATHFARVVGVDIAEEAVRLAGRESAARPGVAFRVADVTDPATATLLAAELGASNVAVRGVLHVLPAPARRRAAAAVAELTGGLGTVLIAETNYRGSLLGYLESLGARPSGLPPPLARALTAGLPRPSPFGEPELQATFPEADWERLHLDAAAVITTVLPGGEIPGLVAVLRRRASA